MKFKDKITGEIFDNIESCFKSYCKKQMDNAENGWAENACTFSCPFNKILFTHEIHCLEFAKKCPVDAARIMLCDIIYDEHMSIEEAIIHAKDVAQNSENCESCKSEHQQLANWLEIVKNYKFGGD